MSIFFKNTNQFNGFLWIMVWCCSFVTTTSVSRFLSQSTSFDILFAFRYGFGFLFFLPFFYKQLKTLPSLVKKPSFKWHVTRSLLIGIASAFTYATYRNIPFATATTIGFSTPLITTILSVIFLKEHLTKHKIIALFLGYIGVFFIMQPSFNNFNIYFVTGLLAASFAALSITITKSLTKTESAITLLMFSSIILGFSSLLIIIFNGFSICLKDLMILIAMAFFGTISQFSYIKALSFAEASFISPFEYLRLILVVPIGYFLFDEPIIFLEFVGAGLIIFGNYRLSKS